MAMCSPLLVLACSGPSERRPLRVRAVEDPGAVSPAKLKSPWLLTLSLVISIAARSGPEHSVNAYHTVPGRLEPTSLLVVPGFVDSRLASVEAARVSG